MTRIRLAALDIDGTLLDSTERLLPKVAAAVSATLAQGVAVVLATGRWLGSARRWSMRLGTTAPLISHSGARVTCQEPPEDLLHLGLPLEPMQEIVAFMDRHGIGGNLTIGPLTYMHPHPRLDPARLPPDVRLESSFLPLLTEAPLSLLIFDVRGIDLVYDRFAGQFGDRIAFLLNRTSGTADHLTLHHPAVDKGRALAMVCAHLGVDPSETLAIGDAESDTAMFDVAGVSVAMGNATDAVKARATATAPSNDDGGVAWALRRFALA